MVVRPERNNAQFQPLTIVLRNIIKEYPAGGGVLRELCQNADDAGASEVEFVLDSRQHPTHDILHDGLAEFQGTSLLAYNNKRFTNVDFDSLSRIGDSAKAKDPNATGKFGRGFNSVYNWTDSPSILSGSSLLILDPHQTWSSSPEVGQPGGPVYNFVMNCQEPEMRNQLAAFSSINDFNPDREFDGTIIRLPLRTKSQAVKSKILASDQPTTDKEILDIFCKFTEELVETLLFLKHLHTITLRVDDKIHAQAVSTTHSFSGEESMHFEKANISAGYKRVFVGGSNHPCLMNFVMDISLRRCQNEKNDESGNSQKFKFAISHHMRQCPGGDLERWSRSQKLFPWVAIATPLEGYAEFEGRLFSALPLPIRTQHPVHIHGMFSITPDRNSIHSGGDWTISEDSEAKLGTKWNEWLLHECVPNAWVQCLEFIQSLVQREECQFSGWRFWPTGSERGEGKLWMGILSDVFKRVAGRNLELFPTICGTTGRREDILFTLDMLESLTSAFKQAGVPVVVPPQNRRHELENLRPYTIGLNPIEADTARKCLSQLKDSPAFETLSLNSRMILLHYILSDANFSRIGLCTAPLVSLMDNTYASFDIPEPHVRSVFLARDDNETRLFVKYKKMVDTTKIPPKTTKLLRKHLFKLQRFSKIAAWEPDDVARYCQTYIFNRLKSTHDNDIIQKDNLIGFVNQLWSWISNNCKPLELVTGSSLKDLFLLPLTNCEYRRLDSGIHVLDVSRNRGIGAFFRNTAASHFQLYGRKFHLFTGDGFSPCVGDSLRKCGLMKDYDDVVPLMTWLTANHESFVNVLSKGERLLLLQHLNALSRSGLGGEERRIMRETVMGLCLFREAVLDETSEPSWVSMSNHSSYIGIKGIPVQLHALNTTFIDTSDPDTEQLVTRLDLVVCPRQTDIFERFVVPGLATLDDEGVKASHVEYVLHGYYALSEKSKEDLSQIKIVPVQCPQGGIITKLPKDTVAPNSVVASLYFGDESWIPLEGFYRRHYTRLLELGMINTITSEVVLERILEYGQYGKANHRSLDEIAAKVQHMMTHCTSPPPLSQDILQSLQWIPAQDLGGGVGLFSALQCRDRAREMLVKYIMPLANFSVNSAWVKCLGWDQPLQKHQLLEQLQAAVNAEDNSVLEYLMRRQGNGLEACKTELSELRWIPSASGGYYPASRIFFDDFRSLSPHFSTLENRFKKFPLFRKLGVLNAPSLNQFKELQEQLARKGILESSDLEMAISIVTEVGKCFSDRRVLNDFKAPDRHGHMHLISDLTAGDVGSADVDLLILHPGIPLDTAQKLGISTFHDRYLELLNDPYFEEEFAQRESPTAVIQDTLKRYPIMRTFSEYLANAEDCSKASKVCWVLDAADNYPKTNLLSPQLAGVQGPALFCYNDGLFSEEDFRGIINIGVGSKGTNHSKIGKFGKGALTMYHWTSVPSFISGEYYVTFDPEQKYLPEHPRTKRPRAGMKLRIENVQAQYPDQLQPFEGVQGFTKNSKSFPGTLFRFPLRRSPDAFGQGSISIYEARKYLEDYYNEAITSLLFLKDITSVSFEDKDSNAPVWRVSSKATTIPTEPHITYLTIDRYSSSTHPNIKLGQHDSDRWCIISSRNVQHVPSPPAHIKQQKERVEARYGLAALISETPTGGFRAQHYVGLPLQSDSKLGLPVHVNADIVVGSNRQSIPIRDGVEGSDWNRWIYESCIAPMYLDLVRHLMQVTDSDSDGYLYWPDYPSLTLAQNTENISRTISMEFWKLIALSPYALYPPVRSPLSSAANSLSTSGNLSLKAATFNLLDPTESEFILLLLSRLGVENIVSPSETIQKGLRETKPSCLSSITPTYLINRLHSSPARFQQVLLEIWAHRNYSMDFFNSVLSFIARESSPTSLMDCTLVPLANLTLGTFLPRGGNESFLVARTPEEREILDISQNLMIHPDLDPVLLHELISSELLNITQFTFHDIVRLRQILDDRDVEYRKKWLVKVWCYLKNYPPYLPTPQLSCLDYMPMYFGKMIGEPASEQIFFCPSDFEHFGYPVILEQSGLTRDALSVLESLKGLILLDKSAFPENKVSQESIKNVTGLYRLLKSIDLLASKRGHFLEDYIKETVPPNSITALRNLFPPQILSELLRKYPSAKEYLLQFPIWPVMDLQALIHQPATKALLPPHPKLSSLGMTTSDVFIEINTAKKYSHQLEQLGVKKMSFDTFLRTHVGVCSGHEITPDRKASYLTLLRTFSNEKIDACLQYPIGIDGNGRFCMANSLYAFDEPIFAAAFRDVGLTHFLHPDYRNLDIWERSSLQKTVTQDRYLACARSIQRRGAQTDDRFLSEDARTVFQYLTWDTPEIRQWSSNTWRDLAKIPFVPTQTVSPTNPDHRIPRMQELSGRTRLTTLIGGILPDYVDIAWSQCPVLYSPPSSFVLGKLSTRGVASSGTILAHLMFLSENRYNVTKVQIHEYSKDIKLCYMHLLGRIPMAGDDTRISAGINVWLNAEADDIPYMTTDEFQRSWTRTSNLCLGLEYDSLPLQRVRSFLAPFQELLEHSNVQKLKGPIIPPRPPHVTTNHNSLVLNGFQRLRRQRRLFDVKLVAQDGQDFDAHWALLSAVSRYWDLMSVSNMRETTTRTVNFPEIKSKTVSIMLDYIYSGREPVIELSADVSGDLEDLIDQLHTADLWELEDLKTILEIRLCDKHWIRPETVRSVLSCAEEVRAKTIIQVCKQYISDNREIVQREEDLKSD